MSFDSWGGGSDADPKLRLRELEAMRRRRQRLPNGRRFKAVRALQLLVLFLLLAAALKHYALT